MKSLTISIPDDVYRAARIRAAEQGTSISAMVRDYLVGLSGTEDRRRVANKRRRELVATFPKGFSAKDNLSRDDLYDHARERRG